MSEWQDLKPDPEWDADYTKLWRDKHRAEERIRDLRRENAKLKEKAGHWPQWCEEIQAKNIKLKALVPIAQAALTALLPHEEIYIGTRHLRYTVTYEARRDNPIQALSKALKGLEDE